MANARSKNPLTEQDWIEKNLFLLTKTAPKFWSGFIIILFLSWRFILSTIILRWPWLPRLLWAVLLITATLSLVRVSWWPLLIRLVGAVLRCLSFLVAWRVLGRPGLLITGSVWVSLLVGVALSTTLPWLVGLLLIWVVALLRLVWPALFVSALWLVLLIAPWLVASLGISALRVFSAVAATLVALFFIVSAAAVSFQRFQTNLSHNVHKFRLHFFWFGTDYFHRFQFVGLLALLIHFLYFHHTGYG